MMYIVEEKKKEGKSQCDVCVFAIVREAITS